MKNDEAINKIRKHIETFDNCNEYYGSLTQAFDMVEEMCNEFKLMEVYSKLEIVEELLEEGGYYD